MSKGFIALFLAIIFGGLGGLFAVRQVQVAERKYKAGTGKLVEVLCAKENLSARQKLKKEDVAVRSIPEKYVHPQVVLKQDWPIVEGNNVMLYVRKGQYLLWRDFAEGYTSDFSRMIGMDRRAMSIRVNDVTGLSGLLRPNCYVDILLTYTEPVIRENPGGVARTTIQQEHLKTLTILPCTRILAVGREDPSSPAGVDRKSRGYATITIEVTPEEAELLTLTTNLGELSCVLRNPESADPSVAGAEVKRFKLEGGKTMSELLEDGNLQEAMSKRLESEQKSAAIRYFGRGR